MSRLTGSMLSLVCLACGMSGASEPTRHIPQLAPGSYYLAGYDDRPVPGFVPDRGGPGDSLDVRGVTLTVDALQYVTWDASWKDASGDAVHTGRISAALQVDIGDVIWLSAREHPVIPAGFIFGSVLAFGPDSISLFAVPHWARPPLPTSHILSFRRMR